MPTFSKPLRLCLLGVGLGSVLLVLAFAAGLRINATASLPRGLYLLCPGMPERGEYAAFCLSGEFAELARERGYLQAGSCPSGLRPLLKRVVALPGDMVNVAALPLRANDSQGRPLPSVLQNGPVPGGMVLLLADHPGSFDGRYFGLVPLDTLQRVRPLFATSHTQEFQYVDR